jgi:hypothetical protein
MYRFVQTPERFDIESNFWNYNYWLKFIKPFDDVFNMDDGKIMSSKFMWAVWLYADPSYQNKIGKLQEDEKKSAISTYNPDFDFKDDLVNKCIVAYDEHCLSDAARILKRTLNNLSRYQEAFEKQMDGTELTFDELVEVGKNKWINKKGTASQLLDVSAKLTKTWKDYEPIKRVFEEEQHSMQLYGGNKPTIVEEGGLIMLPDEE